MGTVQKVQSTEAFIDKLLAENQALRDEIEVLKAGMIAPAVVPPEWGLTNREAAVLTVLARREWVSRETVIAALYSDRTDPPGYNLVAVHVCRIRTKLKPLGTTIKNIWGVGYSLDAATRARLKCSAGTAGFSEEA